MDVKSLFMFSVDHVWYWTFQKEYQQIVVMVNLKSSLYLPIILNLGQLYVALKEESFPHIGGRKWNKIQCLIVFNHDISSLHCCRFFSNSLGNEFHTSDQLYCMWGLRNHNWYKSTSIYGWTPVGGEVTLHSPKFIPIQIGIPSWMPNWGWNFKLNTDWNWNSKLNC